MDTYLSKNNKNIESREAFLMAIAEATVASFKLEGIHLTIEEAYQLAVESLKKRIKKAR